MNNIYYLPYVTIDLFISFDNLAGVGHQLAGLFSCIRICVVVFKNKYASQIICNTPQTRNK